MLGLIRSLTNVRHHNLFFDEDFDQHAVQIYDTPSWPDDPLFYTCFPSITDPSVAPEGKENAFFLIPLGPRNRRFRRKASPTLLRRGDETFGDIDQPIIKRTRDLQLNRFV